MLGGGLSSGTCRVHNWQEPLGKHLRTQAKKQGPVVGAIHNHHQIKEPFYMAPLPLTNLPWVPSKTAALQENLKCPPAWHSLLHPAGYGPQALPWSRTWHPEVQLSAPPPRCSLPLHPSASAQLPTPKRGQCSELTLNRKYTPNLVTLKSSDSSRPDQRGSYQGQSQCLAFGADGQAGPHSLP